MKASWRQRNPSFLLALLIALTALLYSSFVVSFSVAQAAEQAKVNAPARTLLFGSRRERDFPIQS